MEISLADYTIYIAPIAKTLPEIIAKKSYSQIFILTDNNCATHCLPYLIRSVPTLKDIAAPPVIIEAGEIHKNIDTCKGIWQDLLAANADREALLLNLGGGVVGDMGGFVAATYKRGIDFIQIPTTLLAQVDASVGGKLGIDFEGVKNAVGVFGNPQAVLIDEHFLQTLPPRQYKNGMVEMLKHALIADPNHWLVLNKAFLENDFYSKDKPLSIDRQLIAQSVQIKKNIVVQDPYEKGLRKTLNFGHTIGHAIESLSLQYDLLPLLHGEAVGLGILAELYLSAKYTGIDTQVISEITSVLTKLFKIKYNIPTHRIGDFWKYLYNDKKNLKNQLKFSLLQAVGRAGYDFVVLEEDIEEALYAMGIF